MASALPPVKGVAFSFETALVAQADTDIFKAGPTLAAGDVKVIKDGTYDDNIDTLPAAVSSCTNVITVALSATEMDADRVAVALHDAAGDEWQDQIITIFTAAQTLNARDVIADDIKAIVGHADYGNAKLVRSVDSRQCVGCGRGGSGRCQRGQSRADRGGNGADGARHRRVGADCRAGRERGSSASHPVLSRPTPRKSAETARRPTMPKPSSMARATLAQTTSSRP